MPNPKKGGREIKLKPKYAWADVGSHGGIFEFFSGPVADRYPGLLHIFRRRGPGLVRVKIEIAKRASRGVDGGIPNASCREVPSLI